MPGAGTQRRRLLKAALGLPAAALGGCVVAPYGPYYRPATEQANARYKGAWCQGAAGPKSIVELPLAEGITLSATVGRARAEQAGAVPLRLSLSVPPARPTRFATTQLKVTDSTTGRVIGDAVRVDVVRYVTLPVDRPVDPDRVRPAGRAGTPVKPDAPGGDASVGVQFEAGFLPDEIRLEGLLVEHARGPIRMPAVTMRRPAHPSATRDYRSAEWNAALQARAEACRRDTPTLRCENIVPYSSDSFVIDAPDARWSGRWYVFSDGPRARIEGNVAFTLRQAGAWRLPVRTLTLHAADGATRSADIARLHLSVNDRIALDTPLFAGPVDGTADALVLIETALPDAASGFEVRLPDLLVGEQRVPVAPIRFDRRTFDGGVEPFNC